MSQSWVQERITWGKRVHREPRALPLAAGALDALPLRRKEASRGTLPREAVRGWVAALSTLGVVADEESGNGRLRDGLRHAMQEPSGRLRKEVT